MRIVWVSLTSSVHHTGGGGAYSRSLLAMLRALPDTEVVVVEPPRARPRAEHRLRQLRSFGAAALRGLSAKLLFDRDDDVRARLRELRHHGEVDLVVCNGTSAAAEVDVLPPDVPWIVAVHNVEADLYAEQLRRTPTAFRWLAEGALRQSKRHLAYEQAVFGSSAALLFISEDDAHRVRELLGRDVHSLVIPPTFPEDERWRRDARDSAAARPTDAPVRLGFLAKMSWWPNREALQWFLDAIWPEVDQERTELHVFGEGSEAFSTPERAVFGHGFTDELNDVWRGVDVFINPMRSGGGVNVKVCEALFHGFPVLSSPQGLRGLPSFDDPALRVCQNAEQWRSALTAEALESFRRATPRPTTWEHFAAERVAGRLATLLRNIARSPR